MKQNDSAKILNSLGFQSLLIFAVVSLTYWLMRSRGLDDWDSVQFAMGVERFDLFAHRPHPPGYPLYIFAGYLLTLARMDTPKALVLVSCLGGGLFTSLWFYLVAIRFGRGLAWLTAAALALAPMQWMTATKVLTDMAASSMLALELVAVAVYLERRTNRWLVLAAIAGAAGAGMRPQNIGVLLLILIVGLIRGRGGRRPWLIGMTAFLAANLLWLVPVLWTQSRLPEAQGSWLAYPAMVLRQWLWRFDKPDIFVGAGDGSFQYLIGRVRGHLLTAWFVNGFGWSHTKWLGLAGMAIYLGGVGLYLKRKIFCRPEHAAFWRFHLVWAAVYVLMIFCCLPGAVRYYCPILPLLLIPALAGWWSLGGRWRWAAAGLPLLLLIPSAPLMVQNHKKHSPPIEAVRYLKKKHPQNERGQVHLFVASIQRHAQWYGPEFKTHHPDDALKMGDRVLEKATAVYTDSSKFIETSKWKNVELVRLKSYRHSTVIHQKHAKITLFKVVRQTPDEMDTDIGFAPLELND